jgi:hypothetical protein
MDFFIYTGFLALCLIFGWFGFHLGWVFAFGRTGRRRYALPAGAVFFFAVFAAAARFLAWLADAATCFAHGSFNPFCAEGKARGAQVLLEAFIHMQNKGGLVFFYLPACLALALCLILSAVYAGRARTP